MFGQQGDRAGGDVLELERHHINRFGEASKGGLVVISRDRGRCRDLCGRAVGIGCENMDAVA